MTQGLRTFLLHHLPLRVSYSQILGHLDFCLMCSCALCCLWVHSNTKTCLVKIIVCVYCTHVLYHNTCMSYHILIWYVYSKDLHVHWDTYFFVFGDLWIVSKLKCSVAECVNVLWWDTCILFEHIMTVLYHELYRVTVFRFTGVSYSKNRKEVDDQVVVAKLWNFLSQEHWNIMLIPDNKTWNELYQFFIYSISVLADLWYI